MPYRVELAPAAQRELRRLPRQVASRLADPIESLSTDPRPHGVRKVRGQESTWRMRVGSYRVIFDIDDDRQLVVVLKVARRTEGTYRALGR